MTRSDQQLIETSAFHAALYAATCLKPEMPIAARWMLFGEALAALETIEAVADEARDAFAPSLPFPSADWIGQQQASGAIHVRGHHFGRPGLIGAA
ncbi:hypothetical protein J8J14_18290 [Roseomonas sp. SSH11]|uniref:Uncharacterized protein n=2 Tax=Pararoseomonas baculiformis TaxID=2820812 RepID=A0ABS4AI65_9PROT|nr:hypothetical protein [Pararoseomonas baculiformis]